MKTVIIDLNDNEKKLDFEEWTFKPDFSNITKGDIIFYNCALFVVGICYNINLNIKTIYVKSEFAIDPREYFKSNKD